MTLATRLTARDSGNVAEVTRGLTDEEIWTYDYIDSGANAGKLESVSLSRYDDDVADYVELRKVVYTYYGSSEDFGNLGDLKTATIHTPGDDTISTQYWRYFKPGEADGFIGGLKMYLGFSSFDRADFTLDPFTAADSSLDDYADLTFRYDEFHRVSFQRVQGLGCSMCSGGIGDYGFEYETSKFAPGTNVWATKTIESLPDGNQKVVYTNAYGQVMLSAVQEISSKTVVAEWPTYYRYDSSGRVTLTANPSVFQQVSDKYYDKDRADLVADDRINRTGLSTSDIPVNTTTTSIQIWPQTASDAMGNYVVVWRSDQSKFLYWDLYGQRFDAQGQKVGSEFQINTTDYTVGKPDVAMDAQGNFVVVWNSTSGSGDILERRYDRFGNALTGEVTINSSSGGNRYLPKVAMNSHGQYVVNWYGDDTDGYGVYARRFDAAGTAIGSEFAVNYDATDDEAEGTVGVAEDGSFVIAWSNYDDGNLYYRRYSSSGSAIDAGDVSIQTGYSPHIAVDAVGNFVVAFTDYSGVTSSDEVYFARFDADGTGHGTTSVNTVTTNYQSATDIAMDTDGDFVICWDSLNQDGSSYGVYARNYTRDGTATGPSSGAAFRVNVTTSGGQSSGKLAMLPSGNFVATWEGPDASSYGVYCQLFNMSGLSPYLNNSAGLVTTFEYGFGSSTVAATDSTAGYVAGFLKEAAIQRGESGTAVPQTSFKYFAFTDSGVTIHPLASFTVYRNDNGTGGQTTSWEYDITDLQIGSIEITYPTVTHAQNGPNEATKEYARFDAYGRLTYFIDAESHLTYRGYNDATGAVTLLIQDVDTDDADAPIEEVVAVLDSNVTWYVPNTSGLHLTSEWQVDFLGRVTAYTNPRAFVWSDSGNKPIDYTVYDDVNHEVRFYAAWDNTLNSDDGGPTGPIRVYREDWAHSYTESLTMSAVPDVGDGVPIGTEALASLHSLSRTILNDAGQAVEANSYFQLDDVTYDDATVELKGDKGASRQYESFTDYAARGGIKRTVTPNGTITRYIRDAQNRVVEIWIGTNDDPTSGPWAPDNNDADANMVRVSSFIFDGSVDTPGIGDGNLTRSIQYPGGGAENRIIDHFFDWRNRLVATKQGVEASEATDVNRPIFYRIYDNLNHVIESRTYDGDDETISITSGVPDAPDAGLLRSKSSSDFDERGRVYQTRVYEVDPSNGDVGRDLVANTWYDRRGSVIKTLRPGGLVQKMAYDGVGRVTLRLTSDGGGDVAPGTTDNWLDADDAAGDIVYEESHATYDENGNQILTISKERFHETTATGLRGNLSTEPKARLYFAANYFDRANRLTDSVNVGTDGDGAWSRPGTADTRSVTILIYSRQYDEAGRVSVTIDPRGLETHNFYDALARTTKTIQNFTSSGEINNAYPDENKTTEFGYDGSGHLTSYKAWLNDTDSETTEYDYGVVAGVNGNLISSGDLLDQILYPNKGNGNPSESQFLYSYSAIGERIGMIDIKETEHKYSFDVVGRLIADAVVDYKGGNIDTSVLLLATEYDSAGRAYRFTSWDAEYERNVVNQVQREFNGFGQLSKEYQAVGGEADTATLNVQYTYSTTDNHSRLVKITYPNGRELDYNYSGGDDDISRLTSMSDDTVTLESYSYLGLGTVVVRSHADAEVDLTYVGAGTGEAGDKYVGLDRFGRIVNQLWFDTDQVDEAVDIDYGYDEDGNRLFAQNNATVGFDEMYEYDGLNQLKSFERGELSFGPLAISKATREQSWTPDGLGNFVSVNNGVATETRTHNLQNQLTGIATSKSIVTLDYDAAGNMTSDETGRDSSCMTRGIGRCK